jgi:hypothetical protein
MDVDIGIDSHKRSFSVGVVDELGGAAAATCFVVVRFGTRIS